MNDAPGPGRNLRSGAVPKARAAPPLGADVLDVTASRWVHIDSGPNARCGGVVRSFACLRAPR